MVGPRPPFAGRPTQLSGAGRSTEGRPLRRHGRGHHARRQGLRPRARRHSAGRRGGTPARAVRRPPRHRWRGRGPIGVALDPDFPANNWSASPTSRPGPIPTTASVGRFASGGDVAAPGAAGPVASGRECQGRLTEREGLYTPCQRSLTSRHMDAWHPTPEGERPGGIFPAELHFLSADSSESCVGSHGPPSSGFVDCQIGGHAACFTPLPYKANDGRSSRTRSPPLPAQTLLRVPGTDSIPGRIQGSHRWPS